MTLANEIAAIQAAFEAEKKALKALDEQQWTGNNRRHRNCFAYLFENKNLEALREKRDNAIREAKARAAKATREAAARAAKVEQAPRAGFAHLLGPPPKPPAMEPSVYSLGEHGMPLFGTRRLYPVRQESRTHQPEAAIPVARAVVAADDVPGRKFAESVEAALAANEGRNPRALLDGPSQDQRHVTAQEINHD